MLLNAEKSQGYKFYCFSLIKGKPTGQGVKLPPPPPSPRLGLMEDELGGKIMKEFVD